MLGINAHYMYFIYKYKTYFLLQISREQQDMSYQWMTEANGNFYKREILNLRMMNMLYQNLLDLKKNNQTSDSKEIK